MNFIIENWYIILALAAVLGLAAWYVYRYFNLPSEAQLAKVREWLLWAVTEAEKELQLAGAAAQLLLRCGHGTQEPLPDVLHLLLPGEPEEADHGHNGQGTERHGGEDDVPIFNQKFHSVFLSQRSGW